MLRIIFGCLLALVVVDLLALDIDNGWSRVFSLLDFDVVQVNSLLEGLDWNLGSSFLDKLEASWVDGTSSSLALLLQDTSQVMVGLFNFLLGVFDVNRLFNAVLMVL
jgi:hypothetical protein